MGEECFICKRTTSRLSSSEGSVNYMLIQGSSCIAVCPFCIKKVMFGFYVSQRTDKSTNDFLSKIAKDKSFKFIGSKKEYVVVQNA